MRPFKPGDTVICINPTHGGFKKGTQYKVEDGKICYYRYKFLINSVEENTPESRAIIIDHIKRGNDAVANHFLIYPFFKLLNETPKRKISWL